MLLYALLHLTGYDDMTIERAQALPPAGARRPPGHPEYGHTPGVETTTGPLGQGIATAVGMALAERMLDARFGDELVDHYTYVIAGDGCLMEGISHEAISLAGHLGLGRLIVLFDDNDISIDGADLAVHARTTSSRASRPSGWSVRPVDGHDPEAIAAAIERGARQRPAVADRLPHRDRLRRAEPAGHARRRMARRSAPSEVAAARERARLAARAVRDAGGRSSPPGARSARAAHAARRAWIERLGASTGSAHAVRRRAEPANLPCGYAEALAELPRALRGRAAEDRDAEGVADGARRDRRGVAESASAARPTSPIPT